MQFTKEFLSAVGNWTPNSQNQQEGEHVRINSSNLDKMTKGPKPKRHVWCYWAFRVSGKSGWVLVKESLRDQYTQMSSQDNQEDADGIVEMRYPNDNQFRGGLIFNCTTEVKGSVLSEVEVGSLLLESHVQDWWHNKE